MAVTVVTAILMVVGLIGIVVPLLPGLLLIVAATALWASERGDGRAWVLVGVAVLVYALGLVLRYVLPGRRMRRAGVGTPTLLLAVVIAIVGFFALPVVGAPLGFVLGIFLAELARRRDRAMAWTATHSALAGVLASMGIELAAGFTIVLAWVVALLTLGVGG
ncbi:MAG: DUF456 domain-containing protein [Lapillicoccus sp.]